MSVTLVVPGQLRELTSGRASVAIPSHATTVGEAFEALKTEHPGLYDRIFNERRELRPHVNVFVEGEDVRWSGGMETPVSDGSEVVILPAVSGG